MKRIKRGTALVLAGLLMASLLTTALIAANKNWITRSWAREPILRDGQQRDPGYISTVKGQRRQSYGIYMFVEKTVTNFMDWLRAQPDGTTYRAMTTFCITPTPTTPRASTLPVSAATSAAVAGGGPEQPHRVRPGPDLLLAG